jgi:hypothetical protein
MQLINFVTCTTGTFRGLVGTDPTAGGGGQLLSSIHSVLECRRNESVYSDFPDLNLPRA